MITDSLKELIVSRILQLCGKCTIYLFGSYAYGNPMPSSDLDIAVIMDKVESRITKATQIWNALRVIDIPKDIVVVSRQEFDFYKNEAGSIFKTIDQKGIALHV